MRFRGYTLPRPKGPPPPAPPSPPAAKPPERGTVLMLPGNQILVGVPTPWGTAERTHYIYERVNDWLAAGRPGVLVLPFAFDVVDKR